MTKYYRMEIEFSYENEEDLEAIQDRIIDAVCSEEGEGHECEREWFGVGHDVTDEYHDDEVEEFKEVLAKPEVVEGFMESITFKDWPHEDRYDAG